MGEHDNEAIQYTKEVRFPVHVTFTKTYFIFSNLKGVTKHDPFPCVRMCLLNQTEQCLGPALPLSTWK
jgi:hypothetical protein